MASERRELRIQARRLSIPNARELTIDELKDAIAKAENSNGATSSGKKARKAVAVKAEVKKRGRPRKVVEEEEVLDEEETVTPKKRGRPKGTSKTKATASKKTTGKRRGRPPKAEKAVASTTKRGRGRPPKSATAKPVARKAKSGGNGKLGRPPGTGTGTRVAVPDKINWDKNFVFREGSIAGVILDELKKQGAKKKNVTTADVREATIESLEGDLGSDPFVFKHRDGSKYTKAEGLNMLRYRVNRSIFDYARETGQHGKSSSSSTKAAPAKKRGRPAKGEAKTATTQKRGRGRPRKSDAAVETPKRRGRPPKAASAVKSGRGPGRPAKAAGKKRGRPKGSKSKA